MVSTVLLSSFIAHLSNVGFGHGSYFTDGNLYPFLIKNTENDDSRKRKR